ncbi:phosphotransferase enzyme family protein [Paenibacillus hexagrammi]|uniref:Phosphotransferase n=1 Tax=Paenibacillus hexagrammi TaxID=2908839 RepID=A0ABY3SJL0_9BACL|nr:phosphotransferase [Paenibacillus sp. YPD9-1]UJF33889.1 phosphotransferase [Paenibacillus sp. YPD9-1]
MRACFGATVRTAVLNDQGWLNLKWRMETDNGLVFVKYYHPDRYKLHVNSRRRKALEHALQLQHGLSSAGVPCPDIFLFNGQCMQETPSGLCYAVSDWLDGRTVEAGSMNENQMYELGMATGHMHKWLQRIAPLDRPAWVPDKEAYMKEWQENWEKAQEAEDHLVIGWLERSRSIVDSLDFTMFAASPTGWLHWDLWVDNVLLHESGLVGIVDFDRMAMGYPEVDVARAILSGALRDGKLCSATAAAFMNGYRQYVQLDQSVLDRAMRMLYLIESIWWLRTEVRVESGLRGLLGRFVEEMHWIEDHWKVLPELLRL